MDYKSQIMRVIVNHPGATRAYIEKHCGGKHSSTTTHRLHEKLWRYSWCGQEVNVSNMFNSLLRGARGQHG